MQDEHFEDMENIKREMTNLFKDLSKNDMQYCFEQWKKRAKCILSVYFESVSVPIQEYCTICTR